MPDDPIQELLIDIEVESTRYGVGATDLSTRLEEIEQRLSLLPGKIDIMVEDDGAHLHFTRLGADEWGLIYHAGGSGNRWTSLSSLPVREKVAAAELVEPLLVELRAQLTHANETIRRVDPRQERES